ncbi:MAG: IclR family transcriptional regulator [Dehalococcoidia bacterium]
MEGTANDSTMRDSTLYSNQSSSAVHSISRAADILVCLSNDINTVTEVARHCKLSRSTAHRLLKGLEQAHLAAQSLTDHRYYIGPLITELSANPRTTHQHLITCALDEMKRLSEITEDNVGLNVMIGTEYVRLYEIPSRHSLRIIEERDDPASSLYIGATAKVLLSQLDDEHLRTAMRVIETGQITEHSVSDKKVLASQVRETRQRGYAVSYSERIAGAMCISVPIKNYFWPVALSVVGPENRLEPRTKEILEKLMGSAKSISNNITQFFRQRR